MNKLLYRFMSFLIVFALVFGGNLTREVSALSNTYYVGTTGSDTNPGTLSAPFKTFTKAVSVLMPGDTLQVMPGTYNETLTISKSGLEGTPISVIGNGAILNMQGVKANGIVVSGSHILVSKFEVSGATDFGILVTGKSVVVEQNIVHDNVTRNGVGTCGISTSWGSAVKVKVGGENTTLRNNTVFNNCGEGIAVTRGPTALVENNTVFDNFSVNIYVDNSPFVKVQNNLSYCTGTHLWNGNRATGIALGEEFYDGWGAQLHDILISANTIRDCRTGIAAFESDLGGTLTNVAIINNQIPSGERRSISLQTLTNQNVLVSNNLIFNSIYVLQPLGVTVGANTLGSVLPTATNPPLPTNTVAAPSITPTTILASATNTTVPVQASPTAINTATPLPASPTASSLPVLPTFTATSVPILPTATKTTVPPTATSANIPSSTGIIIDDKDGRFAYSPNWQDTIHKRAYAGSYKTTNQNGSYMSLGFTGQSFSVIYKGGPAYGKMDIYVDNILVGTIDQRASSSSFQLRWDYPGSLSPGSHTLKLVFVNANTSGGTTGSVDAVIVR